jgi:hypothetical protein
MISGEFISSTRSSATFERTFAMSSTKTHKHGPVHTYWLYSDGGGKLGPFTKNEARAVVKESPEVRFRARRDGEVEWQEAAVRLAPKKSMAGFWIAAFAVVTISLLAWWWSANQAPHRTSSGDTAATDAAAQVQPSEAATPDAAKNPDSLLIGTETGSVASLPR